MGPNGGEGGCVKVLPCDTYRGAPKILEGGSKKKYSGDSTTTLGSPPRGRGVVPCPPYAHAWSCGYMVSTMGEEGFPFGGPLKHFTGQGSTLHCNPHPHTQPQNMVFCCILIKVPTSNRLIPTLTLTLT